MFCSKCGEILRDNTRRCPVCGASQAKKATQVNTACDCKTNKSLTFATPSPTHSTFPPNIKRDGRTYRESTRQINRASTEAVIRYLTEFFLRSLDFSGRTSRATFWITGLILTAITALLALTGSGPLAIWMLAAFLPTLAMMTRRLHDVGKTGLWLLFGLVPVFGIFTLLFVFCQEGDPGNRYGAKPFK